MERMSQASDYANENSIQPASSDKFRIALLIVDPQLTFCHPDFEMFVRGRSGNAAISDMFRLSQFIYRNLGSITKVFVSSDDHSTAQIFHPDFWLNDEGANPEPFTAISSAEIERGKWRVNPALAGALFEKETQEYLSAFALHYVRELERNGNVHVIWPYHALQGSFSACIIPAIEEALFFHSIARAAPYQVERKYHPLVNYYSIISPDITADHEGRPVAAPNIRLIKQLLDYDAIIIAGEASSHCVAWTVEDIRREFEKRDPSAIRRIHLLTDCMSPVVVPGGMDFTEDAEKAFARFRSAGIELADSTKPLAQR